MTLPVWSVSPFTPLTVANIKTEFDGNLPAEISDYYANSPTEYVGLDRKGFPKGVETPIPTVGNAISVSNFYGASQVPYTITTDKTAYNEGDIITFSVTAPDRNGSELFWTIEDATVVLDLNPKRLPDADRGKPYNVTLSTSNGVAPYSYTVGHGVLPPGLTLSPEGRISGNTTGTGSYVFTVIVNDTDSNSGNNNYTIKVVQPDIQINPFPLSNGYTRVPYSQTLVASGGTAPYQYVISSGSLPTGLVLNSTTGVISGNSAIVGNSTFTVTATDSGQNTGTRNYYIVMDPISIVITPSTLPDAKQDFAYSQQLTASGGQGPYAWSVVDSMPAGLTLSSLGLISGTPVNSGSVSFTVKAVDANGNNAIKTYYLRIISNKWELTLNGYGTAPVSVNEGTTLTFRVKSPETLAASLTAYLVVGAPLTTNSSDISQSTNEVTIVNRQGTSTVNVLADAFTEGAEYFDVWVEYPQGTRKETYGRINVADTSLTPTFTATISPSTTSRGGNVTLSWSTTNPPPNSYVKIDRFNSAATGDSTQYPTTGTKTYSAPLTGGTDSLGGGTWTSQVKLFLANGFSLLTENPNYTVSSATYSITPNKTFLYEGETVTYQITTTNITNGTVLYYVNEGTTVAADFTDNANSGTVTINNNSATLTKVTATNNGSLTSNATQTISISLRSSSISGPLLANATPVLLSGLQNFTIIPDKSSANENETITWNITTTSVPNNTTLYWTNSGTTAAADFSDNSNSGTVVINNQTGSFTRTLANDITTEGSETIVMQLRVNSGSGTVVATSTPVTIADTSLTVNEVVSGPATTAITQTVNISITGGVSNTTFSYTGAASGSGTLDNQGTFTLANLDFTPYGAGTYTYNFLFNATGHTRTYTIVVTAAPVVPTFTNGGFETTSPVTTNGTVVQIPGWKIYLQTVRLNGFSTIQGQPTPSDPTPSPRSSPFPYGDAPAPQGSMAYDWEFANDAPSGDGAKVLRVWSVGDTTAPYGIIRGPYVVSDSIINAQVGDTAEFWWKAQGGLDDFDVFAYLVDETTGNTIRLLDDNGSTTNWTKVSRVIASGEEGTYRFVFISGSYDASGGQALGASLYIDNIKLIKA